MPFRQFILPFFFEIHNNIRDRYNEIKQLHGSENMKYGNIVCGKFLRRINRFIADVLINGEQERVHIKNTGRLSELIQTDTEVILEVSNNPNRKTKYSLIAAKSGNQWVNVDSQAPNIIAFEALKKGKITEIGKVNLAKKEVMYGKSRFDLYFEKEREKGFIEVKGVTLKKNRIAMFPDAPTARGTKHVLEMISAIHSGYQAAILFVVQMQGIQGFTINKDMDPAFAHAVRNAQDQGVKIMVYDCEVYDNELILANPLPFYMP